MPLELDAHVMMVEADGNGKLALNAGWPHQGF